MNKQPKLILGSKSPRRSFLLKQGGFDFDLFTLEVDESFDPEMPSAEVPEFLALKKVNETFEEYAKAHSTLDIVMISADSVVVLEDKILGKPVDRQDAIDTIMSMSNKTHYVYTGVAMKSSDKVKSFTVVTEVLFDVMTMEEAVHYVDTCEPYDKAGSYGIQDWIGYCKIKSIKGSYSNVMGLPMNEMYNAINQWT